MDPKKQLHLKRLKECLEQIPKLEGRSAYDPEFKTWLTQTRSSLIELFGERSLNDRNLIKITFIEAGYRMGRPTGPSPRDLQVFKDGVKMAESVIKKAIEEAEFTADVVETPYEPPPKPVKSSPQITVNVINMLSQVTNVEITQLLQNLNNLGLTASQKAQAEQLTKELDAEVKGQKRWPILGRCIEGLKALGDTVYKQVAIPLLLEMLKKEVGL